ncbi:hypothetical protein, partial [Novosphingobium pentaromativorans]|uniref:hypothetical protein n=1 Tax=Novosphingobium pentaromativorans TaxID=205844 RepID=UPI001EE64BCB
TLKRKLGEQDFACLIQRHATDAMPQLPFTKLRSSADGAKAPPTTVSFKAPATPNGDGKPGSWVLLEFPGGKGGWSG